MAALCTGGGAQRQGRPGTTLRPSCAMSGTSKGLLQSSYAMSGTILASSCYQDPTSSLVLTSGVPLPGGVWRDAFGEP